MPYLEKVKKEALFLSTDSNPLRITVLLAGVPIMAKKTKRKVAYRTLPMQRHFNLRQEGEHFDLGEIFDQLNKRYFRGRLRDYKVEWGRRRKHRPKDHFVFGTIQEEDRVIRIHPLLDQVFVPRWFLKYVLYHEMLHIAHPTKHINGRRYNHTPAFKRDEQRFSHYDAAERWIEQNVHKMKRAARRRK